MKYCQEDGLARMNFDLEVAMEISSQISESSSKAQKGGNDAAGMVARRKQRAAGRNAPGPSISDGDLLSTLKGE